MLSVVYIFSFLLKKDPSGALRLSLLRTTCTAMIKYCVAVLEEIIGLAADLGGLHAFGSVRQSSGEGFLCLSLCCWHLNTACSLLSFLRNPPDLQEDWLFPAPVLRNTSELKRRRLVLRHLQTSGEAVDYYLPFQPGRPEKRDPNPFRFLCAASGVIQARWEGKGGRCRRWEKGNRCVSQLFPTGESSKCISEPCDLERIKDVKKLKEENHTSFFHI